MAAPIFKSNQSLIFQMFHGLTPSSPSSAFHPPIISMSNFLQGGQLETSLKIGIFQGMEKVTARATTKKQVHEKIRRQPTKEEAKKMKKTNKIVIEVVDSE